MRTQICLSLEHQSDGGYGSGSPSPVPSIVAHVKQRSSETPMDERGTQDLLRLMRRQIPLRFARDEIEARAPALQWNESQMKLFATYMYAPFFPENYLGLVTNAPAVGRITQFCTDRTEAH